MGCHDWPMTVTNVNPPFYTLIFIPLYNFWRAHRTMTLRLALMFWISICCGCYSIQYSIQYCPMWHNESQSSEMKDAPGATFSTHQLFPRQEASCGKLRTAIDLHMHTKQGQKQYQEGWAGVRFELCKNFHKCTQNQENGAYAQAALNDSKASIDVCCTKG